MKQLLILLILGFTLLTTSIVFAEPAGTNAFVVRDGNNIAGVTHVIELSTEQIKEIRISGEGDPIVCGLLKIINRKIVFIREIKDGSLVWEDGFNFITCIPKNQQGMANVTIFSYNVD